MSLPRDYTTRIYAGILGKLIGVYLGRPFEGWTFERIVEELGEIDYYVHDRFGDPLVVTDDDIAGTFTFVRALEDCSHPDLLTSEAVGKTWLNYIVEKRSILWWGGNGISTEHTAWLNLERGIAAPGSGSISINGRTVAEQIGAQIFIDGWAMVAPGQPELAASLAREAARVSHDGEAVHAAMLWAAMEAEAFTSADIDRLVQAGLSVIPHDCQIARLVADLCAWHRKNSDWRDTRRRIAEQYGYDKFPGNCHVIPNHALMIMAVLYAPDDFGRAQRIVNTSGWDTDCNAGNVGCLLGLMHGLDGLDAGQDWRGPIADRMLVSSADGGFAVNDAVRMTDYIAGLGHAVDGRPKPAAPKGGAQFHFSLPGSVQGFRLSGSHGQGAGAKVEGEWHDGRHLLSLGFESLDDGRTMIATTPVFASRDVLRMRTYELMASPLVYPGQELKAAILAAAENTGDVRVGLIIRRYGSGDALVDLAGPTEDLEPGDSTELSWILPDCASQPIAEIGLSITGTGSGAGGRVLLDRLGWDGVPELVLGPPAEQGEFWRRAWVNSADSFTGDASGIRISRDRGEGLIIHGTRQWVDYRVSASVNIHLGRYAGLAARVRGLHRFYAAILCRDGRFELLRVLDDDRRVMASTGFSWQFDDVVPMSMTLRSGHITASAGDAVLVAKDDRACQLESGGVGLLVADGAMSVDAIRITSLD